MKSAWIIFASVCIASLVVLGVVFASIIIGKFTGSIEGVYTINVMERFSGALSAFIWLSVYRFVRNSLLEDEPQEDAA